MHARFHCAALAAAVLIVSLPVLGRDAETVMAELGDDYFSAGASVELREPITGDALLAGGTVESNASIGGDATMTGGQVAVRATVGDDLYVAGGQVEVDALVAGSARIAGGRVRIAPETRIEGGTAVAGGTVALDGRFGRYLTVAGGQVTLGGEVAGDVTVYADSLTVLPGTRIGGRLSYRTPGTVTLPADVEIQGGVVRDGGRTGAQDEETDWNGADTAGRVGWLWLAGLFAVGLLLAYGPAAFSRRTTGVLNEKPWVGMGIGFLVLVCVPAISAALFITLIGIPLALIVLLLYLAMLIAAYVIGALYLGDRALAAARPGSPVTASWRLGALFLVLIALALVNSIPVLGVVARLAVLLLGLGGIALALWGGRRAQGPAPA